MFMPKANLGSFFTPRIRIRADPDPWPKNIPDPGPKHWIPSPERFCSDPALKFINSITESGFNIQARNRRMQEKKTGYLAFIISGIRPDIRFRLTDIRLEKSGLN